MRLVKILRGWFKGKASRGQPEEVNEVIPEEPISKQPPPPIKKGSLEDILETCHELRKDLKIRKRLDDLHKKNDDRLYVEIGNLRDRIDRFIRGQK